MFSKKIVVFVFLAIIASHTIFPQNVRIDTAISNATQEISKGVPRGTRIAVLNISSNYRDLSNYIIDELSAHLVGTHLFQVVSRDTVELEAARQEIRFQYTGDVSDETQISLGRFLGAATIISGRVTRDSANNYRLVLNAIDLESLAYQATYRGSILNNSQIKALTPKPSRNISRIRLNSKYTIGKRFEISVQNLFFGFGSLFNDQGTIFGIVVLSYGVGVASLIPTLVAENEEKDIWTTVMIASFSTGAAVGLIGPFLYGWSLDRVSQNNFPFDFGLVSTNNRDINGFKMTYNLKF